MAFFIFALSLLLFRTGAHVENGDWQSTCSCEQASDMRGEFRIAVHGEQQALEICDKAALLELLALKPRFLVISER
ncbi:hypothetical protein [Bradyrhizobium australiense]|uniref:hypothetical protein n=1 Tax=Bradyrhizobium australiense TaxID=2721161 RepID=UPI00289CE1D6|nr:hypothetical protein [Bradyrhizobium australiense]